MPKKSELVKVLAAAEVEKKWAASAWGKKLALRTVRREATDFDRFKLFLAKIKASSLVWMRCVDATGWNGLDRPL